MNLPLQMSANTATASDVSDIDTHRIQLHNQGFTKLEGFLTDDELESLRIKSQALIFRTSDKHRERFKSNGTLCNLMDNPEFVDLIAAPKVDMFLNALYQDASPRWTGGYLISKPAGGPPLFWHQDWWGWDSNISYDEVPQQLFFMYYLTDTTPKNGCLRVIPGSHRNYHSLHKTIAAHDEGLARVTDPDAAAFKDHPDQLPVPVKAGDLLVGDARLIHGAFANTTQAERPLLTLWYIPRFKSLPENVQSRMQALYERKEKMDVDEEGDKGNTPNMWPTSLFNKMKHLAPDYNGSAAPIRWNRVPDFVAETRGI